MADNENIDYYLEFNIDIKNLKIPLEEILKEIHDRNTRFQRNFQKKEGYVFYEILEKEQVFFLRLKLEHKFMMLYFLDVLYQSIHSMNDVRLFDDKK